jgi:DNA-binding IclR family transcriptional regulator
MATGGKKYYQITSLEKGIKVLELLADHKDLSVSGVAKKLSMNRAGAHRFLATLRDLGYVQKNDIGHYELTFRVLELGMKVANRFDIRPVARKYMQDLATIFGETVNLGYLDGWEILHLDKIESSEMLKIDAPMGSKAPAYCTALGKVILAFLPKKSLADYFKNIRLRPHGPNTITSKKSLRKELKEIHEQGYAIDDEELANGLRCVAAPIFDHTGEVKFAMSISCPVMRLPMDRVEDLQLKIKEACRRLSARLGCQHGN